MIAILFLSKITSKSTDAELGTFLASVLPTYDREKVYHSDIRKMISWYNILAKYFPEALEAPVEIAKED